MTETRVVFQGELGANSHIACLEMFPDAQPVPQPTFEHCFQAISAGEADLGMIPIENSLAGRVADIHHLLPTSDLSIVGEHFLPVHHQLLGVPGDLIALTVPTWAPALQVGLTGDTSWRASRDDKKCKDNTTQTAQMNVGDKQVYYCLYRTARLVYTATLVTSPKQVNKDQSDKSEKDSRR